MFRNGTGKCAKKEHILLANVLKWNIGGIVMFKENFMNNIKRARESSKMTQQQVADILNTSRTNITKYETGTLEPNIETIGLLAELYNVSTDWLFGIKKTN